MMKRNLFIFLILTANALPFFSHASAIPISSTTLISDPNLKAYYRFESTTTDWLRNYDATEYGGALVYTTGMFDKGLDIENGGLNTNQFNVASTNLGDNYSAGTYTFWYKYNSNANDGDGNLAHIASAVLNKGNVYGAIQITGQRKIKIIDYQGSYYEQLQSISDLATSTWHMITYTWDNTSSKIYIDGVLDNTGATSTWADMSGGNGTSFGICQNNQSIASFSNCAYGVVDDFAVFNRALNATEISDLFTGGGGPQFTLTAQILYPQNTTSTFIHDFNYFTFEATNTDTISRTYNFRITYDTTSTFSNLAQNVSRNISYVFTPSSTHFLNIPKPQYLATSTTYYAQLCAIIGPGPEYITSCVPTISFKTGDYPLGYQINTENAGFLNSTTTESGILSASTTLDISNANYQFCNNEFYNPATWGCYAGQFLINSWNTFKNFAVSFFQNAVDEIQKVFPLNVLSKVNDDFTSIESTSTETNFVLTGTSTHNIFGNRNFTYLTTSTLANGTLKNAVNFDWEQLVVYLLYALTGVVMILTGYVLLHSSSEQK